MRKLLSIFMICLLSVTVSACSQANESDEGNINPADEIVEPEITEPEENLEASNESHILIAYFTYGENGTPCEFDSLATVGQTQAGRITLYSFNR